MQNAPEDDYIISLHLKDGGKLRPGDREKIAEFLRDQADTIMKDGPVLQDHYWAKMHDGGEGYISSAVIMEVTGADQMSVSEEKVYG